MKVYEETRIEEIWGSLTAYETKNYDIDVATQLIEKGSEFEMFCQFRDRLNQNPALVERYSALKIKMVSISTTEYRVRKSEFIPPLRRYGLGF